MAASLAANVTAKNRRQVYNKLEQSNELYQTSSLITLMIQRSCIYCIKMISLIIIVIIIKDIIDAIKLVGLFFNCFIVLSMCILPH